METLISNKMIEDMLNVYAKEVYKDDFDDVNVKVFIENKSEPDGYGYYGTYLALCAEIIVKKKKTLLGKEFIISDKISLNKEEITDIIRELLRKDDVEVDFISVNDKINTLYFKENGLRHKLVKKKEG